MDSSDVLIIGSGPGAVTAAQGCRDNGGRDRALAGRRDHILEYAAWGDGFDTAHLIEEDEVSRSGTRATE